jgi:hypothetical protein
MQDRKRIVAGLLVWAGAITALHLGLNVNWPEVLNDRLPEAERKLDVAYIPVT